MNYKLLILLLQGNQNVYYSNQMSAHIVAEKIEEKRQEEQVLAVKNITAPIKKIDYDYASFQADYINQVQTARKSNETLNYTDVKEEETVKEAVNKMMDFKETPRNCTKEETKGIGNNTIYMHHYHTTFLNNFEKEHLFSASVMLSRY